tara:strand:+ start:1917 stop:2144 length:228 start_codon:yes stop_codon:yes gene_type:complete
MERKIIKNRFLMFVPMTLIGINFEAYLFELLSEGAEGSVSAQLPFQTRVKVEEYETNDVATEFDFEVTSEVEVWA